MNRHERRTAAAVCRATQATHPQHLTKMRPEDVTERWGDRGGTPPSEVWISRDFLAQIYLPNEREGKLATCRISVSRTTLRADGRWDAGISWDELQQVKRDIGLGDSYAVEVYPRDRDVVNVANMRHLWVLLEPLNVGWFK